MKRQTIFLAIVCAAVCSAGFGKVRESGGQEVALTIYNDDFGVVRESRQLAFDQGVNRTKFTDVASAIDPTSVNFRCVSAPGAVSILEQNYEYDLVNADSLLKRYIDKNVTYQRRASVPGNAARQGRGWGCAGVRGKGVYGVGQGQGLQERPCRRDA